MHSSRKKTFWLAIGEVVAAIAMLAVLMLSFNSVTPVNSVLSSASASEHIASEFSFCGEHPGEDHAGHFGACHACRVTPVALPDAPCVAEPAFGALELEFFVGKDLPVLPAGQFERPDARAPPVSV